MVRSERRVIVGRALVAEDRVVGSSVRKPCAKPVGDEEHAAGLVIEPHLVMPCRRWGWPGGCPRTRPARRRAPRARAWPVRAARPGNAGRAARPPGEALIVLHEMRSDPGGSRKARSLKVSRKWPRSSRNTCGGSAAGPPGEWFHLHHAPLNSRPSMPRSADARSLVRRSSRNRSRSHSRSHSRSRSCTRTCCGPRPRRSGSVLRRVILFSLIRRSTLWMKAFLL